MKKKVKLIVVAVLVIAAAGAMVFSRLQPMEVTAVNVTPKEAYAYFIEDGTVTEGTDFLLYPEVSGTVRETFVKKGDYVNAGDAVLEIDGADYMRQIAASEAVISGYNAQIEAALQSEQNTKDEYTASINELNSQLAQIEAQRKSAEAARLSAASVTEQLELLRITISKLKADAILAEDNVNKLTQLYNSGVISKTELDTAENELESSVSALRQYEAEYEQASGRITAEDMAKAGDEEYFQSQKSSVGAQISSLTQNLSKDLSSASVQYYNALINAEKEALEDARDKLEKCLLITPVSGYVSDIPAEGLSAVSPQAYAAVIKTEGEVKIESYVSTKDVGSISEGGEAILVLKGRDEDKEFKGIIESISKWAETKVSALGLDEKKVRVVISSENTVEELYSGYGLDVRYTVYREQGKQLVPNSAIFTSDGKDYVLTIKDGKAVKTQITKGVKTLTETVVLSGLANGDTVITEANTEGLKEGIRVKAR